MAGLAGRQHGVVARSQLLECGIGRHEINGRLRSGRLHVLHRGIYAVGHEALTPYGRWMAAVLAGGAGAVLSHHAAAALWQLRDSRAGPTDVTIPGQRREVKAIRFHRAVLPADERTTRHLHAAHVFDLAADERPLERMINEADYLRLTDPLSLDDLLTRYPRRQGAPKLRHALARPAPGATRTRSEMEELFFHLLERHGLPRPRVNAQIPGFGEVDCCWPGARLAVELDSRRAHATPAAFERDRERDRLLQARGWRVIRVTWRQLTERPEELMDDLERLLGATVSA